MRSYSKKMYNTGNHSVEDINYDARKKRSAREGVQVGYWS